MSDPYLSLLYLLSDLGQLNPDKIVPENGPPTTYVALITPHWDDVPKEWEEDEDEDEEAEEDGELPPGVRRAWPARYQLDAMLGVDVYAVPDNLVEAEQRRTLQAADGVELPWDAADDPTKLTRRDAAAWAAANWFGAVGSRRASHKPWTQQLLYSYVCNPLEYVSYPVTGIGTPSALVTITLPPGTDDCD